MQGLGPLPLPKAVFNENLLECHDKSSGVTFYFSARDTLADWHTQQQKRLGSRLSPQCYDFTYASPYSGSIDKNKEILREKLRLARCVFLSVFTQTCAHARSPRTRICVNVSAGAIEALDGARVRDTDVVVRNSPTRA